MKTMIIVVAKSNHGKTKSLNALIDLLLPDGQQRETDERNPNGPDRLVAGHYRGVKVGINTLADPGSGWEACLRRLAEGEHPCELIVTACRPDTQRYKTRRDVFAIAQKNGYNVVWSTPFIDHWGHDTHEGVALNPVYASALKLLIDALIDRKGGEA